MPPSRRYDGGERRHGVDALPLPLSTRGNAASAHMGGAWPAVPCLSESERSHGLHHSADSVHGGQAAAVTEYTRVSLEDRPPAGEAIGPEAAGDADLVGPVGIHDPDIAALLIGYTGSIGRPAGGSAGRGGAAESHRVRAIGVHDPDGEVRRPVGLKSDLR